MRKHILFLVLTVLLVSGGYLYGFRSGAYNQKLIDSIRYGSFERSSFALYDKTKKLDTLKIKRDSLFLNSLLAYEAFDEKGNKFLSSVFVYKDFDELDTSIDKIIDYLKKHDISLMDCQFPLMKQYGYGDDCLAIQTKLTKIIQDMDID